MNTNHCTGCTLRNITVYSSAGGGGAVGMIASTSSLLERVYLMPKPGTDRLISATSAVFVGVRGLGSQIRLSRAIRTTDDGFWFYGRVVGSVQSQPSSASLVVSPASVCTVLGDGDSVPNGSPVTFQRPSDGVVVASAVIVSQSAPTSSPPQVTYVFDRALPAAVVGTVMYYDRRQPERAQLGPRAKHGPESKPLLQGHVLRRPGQQQRPRQLHSSARHSRACSLLQAMTPGDPPTPPLVNMTVTRNVIDGTNITSDWWWFELGSIQSVTLTTAFDLMATAPLSNINVTNNFIADSGRSGVWLGNTTGGSVTGNYILAPNARPDLANANPAKLADALQPLVIDATSTGITTASNTIDLTSRRLAVTDAQDRELAAYAPGGVARLSAYNIGTVASPTVTLTDADGNTSAMTVQSSEAHALDVQVPAGAALGGAFVTLTSGGAKYFGTLFLDSQDNIPAVNGCTFQSSVSSMPVASVASTVPILVVTQAGCSYQVVSMSAFVTAGGGGTGTGVVSVNFAANGGAARTATIEIAGQPVAIPQSAASRYDRTNRPPGLGHRDNGAADVGSARSGFSDGVRDRSRQQRGREQPRDARHGQLGDDVHDGGAVGHGTSCAYAHVAVASLGGASNEVVVNVTGACSAPSTPGGLTHTVNGSSVQLSWQAAAGATSYVLEAGTASGSSNLLASDIGNVTTLGATAAPGTYYVRIRARSACGSSPPSNEVVVVVAGCAPTLAPATPSATVTNGTVSVSWGAVAGATGYVVEAGLSPGATNAGVFQVSGTSIAGAAPPGRYYVRIRARNGCGVGPASSEIVIDVP